MSEPANTPAIYEPLDVLASCGHPVARTWVNPLSGKRQCLDCRRQRYAERVRRGEVSSRSAGKTVQEPRRRADPLAPEELERLRALVACVGCGAVRQDRPAAKKGPYTQIRHRRGCPVARNREGRP